MELVCQFTLAAFGLVQPGVLAFGVYVPKDGAVDDGRRRLAAGLPLAVASFSLETREGRICATSSARANAPALRRRRRLPTDAVS